MKKLLLTASLLLASIPANAGQFDDLSDDDKAMVALSAVLTVNYDRCGGRVVREQWESVSTILHDLGPEVAQLARVIERKSCRARIQLYHAMRAAAAQVTRR